MWNVEGKKEYKTNVVLKKLVLKMRYKKMGIKIMRTGTCNGIKNEYRYL